MNTTNTTQTILLTGATGLLGRRLSAKLLQQGYQLIVLSRRPEKAAELGDGIRVVRNISELPHSQPLHAIIHLAGEPVADKIWSAKRKRYLKQSRAELPAQIGEWLAQAEQPPSVWLGASAIGWYGTPKDVDREFIENDAAEGGFAAELCAHIEAAADQATAALRAESLIRSVHLRIGLVLATPSEGGYLAKLVTPVKFMLGATLGDGRQWQSWIHVDDTVDAILHCLTDASCVGPVNLTAPNPERAQDLMQAIGAAVKRPVLLRVPGVFLRLVAGDMADDLLLASQRVLPSRLLESGFQFQHPKLAGALKHLLSGSR